MKLSPKQIRNKQERTAYTRILRESGLPVSDVDGIAQILIGYYHDNEMVGTGGIEFYGSNALLRSVSLLPSYRGKHFGSFIVSDLLAIIKGKGARKVFLLTETAPDFFQSLGFVEISRESIPVQVRWSSEFRDVCPTSARAMWKDISSPPLPHSDKLSLKSD